MNTQSNHPTVKPIAHLSWADRFGILHKMPQLPTDDEICRVFRVDYNELHLARICLRDRVFRVNTQINSELYERLFNGEEVEFPPFPSQRTRTYPEFNEEDRVLFASRREEKKAKQKVRRSNNIDIAFKNVPTVPTPVEPFAEKYRVSVAVLRQHKRFDKVQTGPVFVRKNKETGVIEIWRDVDGKEGTVDGD